MTPIDSVLQKATCENGGAYRQTLFTQCQSAISTAAANKITNGHTWFCCANMQAQTIVSLIVKQIRIIDSPKTLLILLVAAAHYTFYVDFRLHGC